MYNAATRFFLTNLFLCLFSRAVKNDFLFLYVSKFITEVIQNPDIIEYYSIQSSLLDNRRHQDTFEIEKFTPLLTR